MGFSQNVFSLKTDKKADNALHNTECIGHIVIKCNILEIFRKMNSYVIITVQHESLFICYSIPHQFRNNILQDPNYHD